MILPVSSAPYLASCFVLLVLWNCGCSDSGKSGPAATSNVVSDALDKIEEANEPLTLVQLDRFYEALPASENAAVIYEEAFAALVSDAINALGNTQILSSLLLSPTVKTFRKSAEMLGRIRSARAQLAVEQP